MPRVPPVTSTTFPETSKSEFTRRSVGHSKRGRHRENRGGDRWGRVRLPRRGETATLHLERHNTLRRYEALVGDSQPRNGNRGDVDVRVRRILRLERPHTIHREVKRALHLTLIDRLKGTDQRRRARIVGGNRHHPYYPSGVGGKNVSDHVEGAVTDGRRQTVVTEIERHNDQVDARIARGR